MADKNYLQLKPEDLAKVEARRKRQAAVEVDEEWLAIAEFGKHYGWAAVEAILDNRIDGQTMAVLLAAARKVESQRTYDASQAVFIGSGAVRAQNPADTFRSLTAPILQAAKADV